MIYKSPEKRDPKNVENPDSFSHLKWPSIIMAILIVILIGALDFCSRVGNL